MPVLCCVVCVVLCCAVLCYVVCMCALSMCVLYEYVFGVSMSRILFSQESRRMPLVHVLHGSQNAADTARGLSDLWSSTDASPFLFTRGITIYMSHDMYLVVTLNTPHVVHKCCEQLSALHHGKIICQTGT